MELKEAIEYWDDVLKSAEEKFDDLGEEFYLTEDDWYATEDTMEDLFDDILIASGSFKGVLISSYSDFVLKICFEDNDYELVDEAEVYKEAQAKGYDTFLAPSYRGPSFRGRPTILQKKVEILGSMQAVTLISKTLEKRDTYDTSEKNTLFMVLEDTYGEELMNGFVDDYYQGEHINLDLASRNLGYLNGHLVVVDYGGFDEIARPRYGGSYY